MRCHRLLLLQIGLLRCHRLLLLQIGLLRLLLLQVRLLRLLLLQVRLLGLLLLQVRLLLLQVRLLWIHRLHSLDWLHTRCARIALLGVRIVGTSLSSGATSVVHGGQHG